MRCSCRRRTPDGGGGTPGAASGAETTAVAAGGASSKVGTKAGAATLREDEQASGTNSAASMLRLVLSPFWGEGAFDGGGRNSVAWGLSVAIAGEVICSTVVKHVIGAAVAAGRTERGLPSTCGESPEMEPHDAGVRACADAGVQMLEKKARRQRD